MAITESGFTETDNTFTGGGGGTFQSGEKERGLSSTENPIASWTGANRAAAVAFVVNPAS